jgi:hypothetical protein
MKPAITHLVSEILTHNIIMDPKKQLTADTNDRQLDRRGRSWPVANIGSLCEDIVHVGFFH